MTLPRRGWVQALHRLALSERERLERTLRFRLGSALLAAGRGPGHWLPALRVGTQSWRAGFGRELAAVAPPYPEIAEGGANAGIATPGELADLRAVWARVWAVQRSPEFRTGERALLILSQPWQLLHRANRREAAFPVEVASRASEVRGPAVPVPGHQPFRVLGPRWLEEMMAQQGSRGARASGGSGPLLLAFSGSEPDASHRERWEREAHQVSATGAPVLLWVLGEPRLPAGLAEAATHLLADTRRTAELLSAELGRPVEHLPPGVAPRLHNPIGFFGGRSDLSVAARHDSALPPAWRELVALARGQVLPSFAGVEALEEGLSPADQPSGAGVEWTRDRMRQGAVRLVMRHATLSRRLGRALELLGETEREAPKEHVSILICTRRPPALSRVHANIRRQSRGPDQVVLVLHGDGFEPESIERWVESVACPVQVVRVGAARPLGDALAIGCELVSGTIVCRMDDDDWYGTHYVEDTLATFGFSEAQVVGKTTYLVAEASRPGFCLVNPGQEYRYTSHGVSGCRMAFRRGVLDAVRFRPLARGSDLWFGRDCLAQGLPILSSDRFNFVYHRGAPHDHTATSFVDTAWHASARRLPRQTELHDFE